MHNSNPESFVEEMIDELLTDITDDTDFVDSEQSNTDSIDKDKMVDIKNEDACMDSIQLSNECTIYEIAQIHQQIHDNWQGKTALRLDVSAVSEVDASFIQLLASCKKMADDNKQSFELLNPSEVVSNRMKAMYINTFFNTENTSAK